MTGGGRDGQQQQQQLGAGGAAAGGVLAAGGAGARCLQAYRGHVNERNFVGLSVQGDLIAAGSETNEVSIALQLFAYTYHALV